MKKLSNRILALAMSICMICGMLPMSAHATETEHTCDWGEWTFNKDGTHTRVCNTDSTHIENGNCAELEWTYDSNGHSGRWLCDVCNGGVDKNSMDYPEHIYSNDTDLTCDTCGYVRSVEGSLSITGDLPAATVGVAYSASLSYTGEVSGVVFWNATGLPDGLTVDYGTGTISGTPTTAGTYEVTISMGATGGGSASKNFTLTVNATHTHVWSDDWSSSKNYHWHDCTAEGCNLNPTTGTNKDGYATHEFEIIRDTHSYIDPIGFGFHYGTCVECGRSDSEIIIATTRQFDATHHWYECPCGVTEHNEEHSFDDDADMLCDTCGYERTVGGGTTVNGVITLTPADLVNGANGEGWSFDGSILTIESGYTLNFEGKCEFNVDNYGTISGGTFSGNVDNDGTISGGTFNSKVKNDGTISGGTFGNDVTNQGTITNGIFSGGVSNNDTISGGTFSGFVVNNTVYAVISNGTFSGNVANYGTISGGTFSGDIDNYAYIEGGSFRCDIDGIADIPGVTLIHSPGTEWESDGTNHWHECSCGAKADSAAHSGGTATCTSGPICMDCGTVYGEPDPYNHDFGGPAVDVGLDETHRYYCQREGCNEYGVDYHVWVYTDCTSPGKCDECGAEGSKQGHKPSACTYLDDEKDYIYCVREGCGVTIRTDPHAGGTATCTEKAVCEFCAQPYGNTLGHDWGNWLSNGDGTHTRTCANDASHTETNDCSGGTATCTEKAKCSVCAAAYGDLAEHTYGTDWKSGGTNHWHECSCGAKSGEAAHSGGTATCKDKAVCSVCGTAYGDLDSTNHAGGTEVKDAKDATCGEGGYTGDTYCKGCGEVLTKGTATNATGDHTYGNWKVVKEATTTAKGKEQRTCSACGHVESRDIPMISDVPQTGDESDILLWAALMCVGILGVVVLLAENKRRRSTK